MTLPRKSLVSLAETPYYHCVSRCVRRAFLCGVDHYTGQSYEHRRSWLEQKLLDTASVFAIKLCSYAVMSNHYHVVLHVRQDLAESWSNQEVVTRWHQLFNGTLFSRRYLAGDTLLKVEQEALDKDIALWRKRLTDISWFMRIVNECIARKANAEDQCTGSFWESRFKSQALLDERALLSCMTYVDLNPIRAGMAKTPETSRHTSVHKRIAIMRKEQKTPSYLERFAGIKQEAIGIPFKLEDYLDLVDWTGRIIRQDKRGAINPDLPPILERLNLPTEAWKILTTQFEQQFQHWVGSEQIVQRACENQGYRRTPSTKHQRRLFPT
jgi:REP element-mobilizing transposase RayT